MVRNYKRLRQIGVYLHIIYGIVIVKIHSCNKELYTYKVTYLPLLYHLSVQRLENPTMSIVYCSAPAYIYMQHLTPRQP